MKARIGILQFVAALALLLVFRGAGGMAATIEFFDHGAFLSATDQLTVVDFDGLTTSMGIGTLNGDEFVAEGLTIVHRDGLPITVVAFPGASLNSAPNGIGFTLPAPGQHGDAGWQLGRL